MQQNFNNLNNFNMNNIFKIMFIVSFMLQWSILSFILNLVTLWFFRIPLFLIFILDALSMLIIQNKTLKRPSFVLSKIWDLLEFLHIGKKGYNPNIYDVSQKVGNSSNKIKHFTYNLNTKINNFKESIFSFKKDHFKYKTERNRNKFSPEIGNKVIVEQIIPGKKIQKKSFKYKDRAASYINVLKENGYKDFTKYNLDVNTCNAYLVVNKKRDIIDVENNSIALSHESKDYNIIVGNWPKK